MKNLKPHSLKKKTETTHWHWQCVKWAAKHIRLQLGTSTFSLSNSWHLSSDIYTFRILVGRPLMVQLIHRDIAKPNETSPSTILSYRHLPQALPLYNYLQHTLQLHLPQVSIRVIPWINHLDALDRAVSQQWTQFTQMAVPNGHTVYLPFTEIHSLILTLGQISVSLFFYTTLKTNAKCRSSSSTQEKSQIPPSSPLKSLRCSWTL